MSIDKIQDLSLIADPKIKHDSCEIIKDSDNTLRIAMIYGPNASGKSSLVRAILYSQLVALGEDPILICPQRKEFKERENSDLSHRSNRENGHNISYFEYILGINGKTYSYGFEVATELGKIDNEWLLEVEKNGNNVIAPMFEINFKTNKTSTTERSYLSSVYNDKNNSLENYNIICEIYRWFANELIVNTFDSDNIHITIPKDEFDKIKTNLKNFDTWVEDLSITNNDAMYMDSIIEKRHKQEIITTKIIDNKKNDFLIDICKVPNNIRNHLAEISEDECCISLEMDEDLLEHLYYYDKYRGKFRKKEIMFINKPGNFPMYYRDESDGTKRIFQFLMVLNKLSKIQNKNACDYTKKTIIIDEIDRSLHQDITIQILKKFKTNEDLHDFQLIATTHEIELMDYLNDDEVWFIEKINKTSKSNLYSLSEFDLKGCSDIISLYLSGRVGGTQKCLL